MSFTMDCRSDLSDLRALHPEFFNKLNKLRIEIDYPSGVGETPVGPVIHMDDRLRQDEALRRRRLQAQVEIDEIMDHIHQLPGFDGFQRAPTAEDLMAMASEGPIVICNCNALRSDAIIVTGTSIRSLSLPGLIYSEITDRITQFTRLVQGPLRTSSMRNKEMSNALLWLWEVAVGPVFGGIGPWAYNRTRTR